MTQQPDWGGEQSGFDDFEFTFEAAKFGYVERLDAVSGKNELRLIIEGEAQLDEGKTLHTEQSWKIGKGWDAIDDGASVAKEDGSELKPMKNPFNYQTGMSRLVRAAIGCGAGEIINQRCSGDPANLTHAGVWAGLKFRMQRLPQGTMDDGKEWSMLLPTEFLGEVGGPSSAGGSTGTTSSTSTTANGTNGSLEELAASMGDEQKMDFLTEAVQKRGANIGEAEKVWDAAHA